MEEEKTKKRKANRIRPLWRDLMKYQYSPPLLQKYQAEMMNEIPVGSTKGGILGIYDIGENSKDVQREVARINAENDYILARVGDDYMYPAERYRSNKPKRIATKYNPERFAREAGPRLPALLSQPAYTATDPMTKAYETVEREILPGSDQYGTPALLGSSYIYQANRNSSPLSFPDSYKNIDPNVEFTSLGKRVLPGLPDGYLNYESSLPIPEPRFRKIPLEDLREIFSESEWPVVHQSWPEGSIVKAVYYPNTPGSQRIADYYGFKGMQDEARREFYNTPPVTMVMPRPIIRPQQEYDPVVAGYLPLMKLPQTADEQRPFHIHEFLKDPLSHTRHEVRKRRRIHAR